MHRRIAIRNFRSIEDATVELSPFTVVVGPNGSGKSNFVDSLVFMRDVAFDAETAVSGRGGISSVTRWSRTRPYDVHLELRVAATSDKLDSEYFAHDLTIQSAIEGAWKFKRETVTWSAIDKPRRLVERTGGVVTGIGKDSNIVLSDTASAMVYARQMLGVPPPLRTGLLGVRRYRLSPDAMRQPQLVSESSRLGESGTNIATALRKLQEQDRFEPVLLPMRRIVPGLKDIRAVSAGRHLLLEFDQEQGNGIATFTSSEISEGALRALGVIVAARQMAKNELLIIEEPEANIHAGAAGLIFDVLREASRLGSVLITTHSPEILDAARDEDIVVCNYAAGVTRLGPLDSGQRELVRQGLFSLAELMRSEPLRIDGDLPEAAKA
jgi:type I restriction enzyme M protein